MGLGVIAFVDGLLFRFVYPNAPEAQSLVGFFLLFALSGSGFMLAAHGFADTGSRRAVRVMRGLALLSLIGFLASLVSPGTFVAAFSYVLAGGMPVAVLLGTGAWRKRQGGMDRMAWWLALIVAGAIIAVFAALIFGWRSDRLHIMGAIRAVYVILLMATITNFAAYILFIRRQHALEVTAKLAALEAEAKRSQELLQAEQNYSRARDLAQLRQRQLASASHDFRQPLASLRMTMDSLGAELDPGLRARLVEAFDYMETLTGDYLTQTTGEAIAPAPSQDPETEAYPLSMILQTVWQMFHEEAISKGLRLRTCDSALMTTVPAIVLMRIVSNLASNAVKYTDSGGVLMGVRRHKRGAEIWVCDTGPGLSANEISEFRQEGRKGAQSKGHGLGLAVCFGLAQEHGLDLTLSSVPDQGTVFRLTLPQEVGSSVPH
jgi:signal transduction histidine kinase